MIVIVVIGILAAITIVAYNGIQKRARNTQTIQAVEEFVKAYHLYAIDNGDYPNMSGCLGEGYSSNVCLSQSGVADCFSLGGATNASINTTLKPYMNNGVPNPSTNPISCGVGNYAGAYASYTVATKTVIVIMVLQGDQTCPPMSPNASAAVKVLTGDANLCRYTLQAV